MYLKTRACSTIRDGRAGWQLVILSRQCAQLRSPRQLRYSVVMRGVALLCVGLLAAACSGGTGGVSSGNATSIEFATQGLGSEGNATKKAVADFEKANPNIHVN